MLASPATVTEAVLGSTLKIRTLRVLRRHPTREFTVRELAREGVEYAALFGSAARGELGPDSDVDLLIVSRTPKAVHNAIVDLADEVHRLFGRPLSPLVLGPAEFRKVRSSRLGESLRREGIPLYGRKGSR